jgi:hypothetical protein
LASSTSIALFTVGTVFRDLVTGLDEDPPVCEGWDGLVGWVDPHAWEDPVGWVDLDGWGGPYNLTVLTVPWNYNLKLKQCCESKI